MRRKLSCCGKIALLSVACVWAGLFCASEGRAATIGYYILSSPGNTAPETSITMAGHTPVQLAGLSAADLAAVDVVWILNPNNFFYTAEMLNNLDAISAYVQGGGALMFHDRFVADAASVIPGAAGVNFVRDSSDGANIELGPGATGSLISGPGGIIDNDSLDGGDFSSHGYALASTLPAGSVIVLTRTSGEEVVDFYYSLGGGEVYYSTIPLDHYLNGIGAQAVIDNMQAYAANLAAFIFEILGPSASPLQFQHIAMADTLRSDIDRVYRFLEEVRSGLFFDIGSGGVKRGNSDKGRSFRSWDNSLMLGYGHAFSETVFAGAAFSYHDAGNRSRYDRNLKGDYDSYGFTAFGRLALPALAGHVWWLDLAGNFSLLENVNLRRGNNAGQTDGHQYGFDARIGTMLSLADKVGLYPKVGAQHIRTRLSRYEEAGAGGLKYGALDTNVTYGVFSLEARPDFIQVGNWGLRPSLLVEYKKRIGQSAGDVKTTLAQVASDATPLDLYSYDTDLGKLELKFAAQYGIVAMSLQGGFYFGNSDLEGFGGGLSIQIPL